MERTVVDLHVDKSTVDTNTEKKYHRGRIHVHARSLMPEKQLFSYAEYHAQAAEQIGYSEYSYWKSVWRNFLKKKMAVVMLVIDNIPTIIYINLIALMIGKSTLIMGIAMIAFYWLGTARNVRNLVLMYRDREYNLASRCLGTSLWRILSRNIFPYLVSVIVLRLALSIPGIIAYETTLSYLGLLDISTPSLGILLRNARSYFMDYPYMLVFPAAIVSLITITFYLVGNAFSDACDPRNHV